MAIVDDDIERVRTSLSIVDVIQPFVTLRRVGRNWVGLCPFHTEKSGSFNVREEMGRFTCFGCGKSGDIFTFIQEHEHVDFVTAVEQLASKAGIQLSYTTGGQERERGRRKQLIDAMAKAVDWYHDRLLKAPDARAARDYLRSRGLSGDVARQFRIGWAPDDWDQLSRDLKLPADVLRDTGLAFNNKRDRLQDAFRGRVLFPIFSPEGDPIALGGRILPGSTDPAKYKNSPETAIYAKSKTLYGMNWAKGDIVAQNQVIICEGYTDVIGFHRAGVPRAVATCGTALTEEHVRAIKRYANKVVLAFDADAAGQGAAEKFYEWEQKYQIEVSVAHFPNGRDPGDLASSDPGALKDAVDKAEPFLGFRLHRVLASRRGQLTPEQRSRLATDAMKLVNEHPDLNVRKIYAGEVANRTGLPINDMIHIAERRRGEVRAAPVATRRNLGENAEFAALALLLQRWTDVADWMFEWLFADELHVRAFRAIAAGNGSVEGALDAADPEAREIIERAVVVDLDVDPAAEVKNLIGAAVRRRLQLRTHFSDPHEILDDRDARVYMEGLEGCSLDDGVADWLLEWLDRRNEEIA